MPATSLTGSRIRDQRLAVGLRQADLARDVGISPSYLNLIEHNRRRIAGKLLGDIAFALNVEPNVLSEGAEAGLIEALEQAAAKAGGISVEASAAADIAARYPTWAQLIAEQSGRVQALEHTVNTLTDRLANDPFLTSALHEVISSVTSIRSSSSILIGSDEIDQEWQQRFQQNIFNDSRRLAESAQSLASYLDGASGDEATAGTPRDECFAAFKAAGHHFEMLEDASADEKSAQQLAQATFGPKNPTAREMFRSMAMLYLQDAKRIPLATLPDDPEDILSDPAGFAARIEVPLAVVLRRLAHLPMDYLQTPVGFLQCDATGAITARREIAGFDVPSLGAGCALWPLYGAFAMPGQPLRTVLQQDGQSRPVMLAYTTTEQVVAATYETASVSRAVMLIRAPQQNDAVSSDPLQVGAGCNVCAIENCAARREPSILATSRL